MAEQEHVILRQTLVLEVTHDQCHATSKQLLRTTAFQEALTSCIEEVCAAHVPPDQVVSIGKLQLDLGTCALENLHTHIVTQVRQRLPSALARHTREADKNRVATSTLAQAQQEALLYYLTHGCAHWKHPWSPTHTPERAYQHLLTHRPGEVLKMWWRLRHCPEAAARCAAEFSADTVQKTMALLTGSHTDLIMSMARRAMALETQLQPYCRGRISFVRSVWEALLRQAQVMKACTAFDLQHFAEGFLAHLSALTHLPSFQIAGAMVAQMRSSISQHKFSEDAVAQSLCNLYETVLDPFSIHESTNRFRALLLHARSENELHTQLQKMLCQLPVLATRSALAASLKDPAYLYTLAQSDACFYTIVELFSSKLKRASQTLHTLCSDIVPHQEAHSTQTVWTLLKRFVLDCLRDDPTEHRVSTFSVKLAVHVRQKIPLLFYKVLSLPASFVDKKRQESVGFDKNIFVDIHQAIRNQDLNDSQSLSPNRDQKLTRNLPSHQSQTAAPQTPQVPTAHTATSDRSKPAVASTQATGSTSRTHQSQTDASQPTQVFTTTSDRSNPAVASTQATDSTSNAYEDHAAASQESNTYEGASVLAFEAAGLVNLLTMGLHLGWYAPKRLEKWCLSLKKITRKRWSKNNFDQRCMLNKAVKSLLDPSAMAVETERSLNSALKVWLNALEQIPRAQEVRQALTALFHRVQPLCSTLHTTAAFPRHVLEVNRSNAIAEIGKGSTDPARKVHDVAAETVHKNTQKASYDVPYTETDVQALWKRTLKEVSDRSSLSVKTLLEGMLTARKAYRTHLNASVSESFLETILQKTLLELIVVHRRTNMTTFELVYRMILAHSVPSTKGSQANIMCEPGAFEALSARGFAWRPWLPWCWAVHHTYGWTMSAVMETLRVATRRTQETNVCLNQWVSGLEKAFFFSVTDGSARAWLSRTCRHWYSVQHASYVSLWSDFLHTQRFPTHFQTVTRLLDELQPWIKSSTLTQQQTRQALDHPPTVRILVEQLDGPALYKFCTLLGTQYRDTVVKYVEGWLSLWRYIQTLGYTQHAHFRKLIWHQALVNLGANASDCSKKRHVNKTIEALSALLHIPSVTLLQNLSTYALSDLSWAQRFPELTQQVGRALTAHRCRTRKEAQRRWPNQQPLQDLYKILREGLVNFLQDGRATSVACLEQSLYKILPDQAQGITQAFGKPSSSDLVYRRFVRCFSPSFVQTWTDHAAGVQKGFVRRYLRWVGLTDVTQRAEWQDPVLWQMHHRESVLRHLMRYRHRTFSRTYFIQDCLEHVQKCTGLSLELILSLCTVERSLEADLEAALGVQILSKNAKLQFEKNSLHSIVENAAKTPDDPSLQVHVENGGLAFIWPFIETLLRRQELLEEADFVDALALQNSVHALQYAVSNRLYTAGWKLLLNKLLCGMPYNAAVATGYRARHPEVLYQAPEGTANPTPQPLEIHRLIVHTQNLLQEVMKAWPSLKELEKIDRYKDGLTWADFQEYFLNRTALLQRIGNDSTSYWHLSLPSLSHDSKRLFPPWSMDSVQLPWMEQPLVIHWMV